MANCIVLMLVLRYFLTHTYGMMLLFVESMIVEGNTNNNYVYSFFSFTSKKYKKNVTPQKKKFAKHRKIP